MIHLRHFDAWKVLADAQTGARGPWPPNEPNATNGDASMPPEHADRADGIQQYWDGCSPDQRDLLEYGREFVGVFRRPAPGLPRSRVTSAPARPGAAL